MLEKLVAAIVMGLISWLEKRVEKSKKAVVADRSRETLERAGDRLAEWMRANGAGGGGGADADRPGGEG